jgi:hypothetical protein
MSNAAVIQFLMARDHMQKSAGLHAICVSELSDLTVSKVECRSERTPLAIAASLRLVYSAVLKLEMSEIWTFQQPSLVSRIPKISSPGRIPNSLRAADSTLSRMRQSINALKSRYKSKRVLARRANCVTGKKSSEID